MKITIKDSVTIIIILISWYHFVYQTSNSDKDFKFEDIDDLLLNQKYMSILITNFIIVISVATSFLIIEYLSTRYLYQMTNLSIYRDERLACFKKELSESKDSVNSRKLLQKIKNLEHQSIGFGARVSSSIHSTVITFSVIYVLLLSKDYSEHFVGYIGSTNLTGGIIAFSAGYFIQDLVYCIKHYYHGGLVYLIHAMLGLILCLSSMFGYMQYHGILVLFNEFSTMFMNISWFCKESNMPSNRVRFWSQVFYISFLFFRNIIMFWVYRSIQGILNIYYYHLHRPYNQFFEYYNASYLFDKISYSIITFCLLASFILNYYWGTKVIPLLLKGKDIEEPSAE